jgi:tight adherence protein B
MQQLFNNPYMLPFLVFVAIVALVGIVAFVFRDASAGKATERLENLVGGKKRKESAELLLKQVQADKETLIDLLTPKFFNLQTIFEQADCNIKPSSLFGLALIFGAAGATLSWIATFKTLGLSSLAVAPFLGLVMFSLPFLWLLYKRADRLKKFAAQLPDALELVARALRAGHSLAAGMHVVAEEMPSPIADEFGRVYEEQNLGIAMDESMRAMCNRVPNMDLRFFVTAVAIQRQTGGDLAEILDKIGYVIRERYRILGQVKALTAEGRLSGVVLIALPFALFGLMLHMKPDYIKLLWETPTGRLWSILALIAQVLGALVIKKIVDIKV